MKLHILLKTTAVLILLNVSGIALAQQKLAKYQDFDMAYNHTSFRTLSEEFNLLYMTLLDSSGKEGLFHHDTRLVKEYGDYTFGIHSDKHLVGFVTSVSKIDDIFTSKRLAQKVLGCVSDTLTQRVCKKTISRTFYIRDNEAIIDIITVGSGKDTYHCKLQNGILQIRWLEGVIY